MRLWNEHSGCEKNTGIIAECHVQVLEAVDNEAGGRSRTSTEANEAFSDHDHEAVADDIQQTRLMTILSEKNQAPSGSNPVAMQSYFDNLNARAEDARLCLNDIEDLN